jgi:ABC-type transport system substrate-binding protein
MANRLNRIIPAIWGFIILMSIIIALFIPQFFKVSFNKLDDIQLNLNMHQDFNLNYFYIGISGGPSDLDPVHSMDRISNDMISQVAEGLFMHDFSDPDLNFVPRLAADYGIWDATRTHYTVPLRQGVKFHDGTKFNASSVKWNFERINWFLNATGNLDTTLTKCHPLWRLSNGSLLLDAVNPVTINNEYSVTINLAAPYTIFEKLLCYVNAYMLSPKSTPKYEIINTNSFGLVGTGPFVYYFYDPSYGFLFERWSWYWREPTYITGIIFRIMDDNEALNYALLNGYIHFLYEPMSSMLSTFRNNSDIIVEENEISSLEYYYLGMNNEKINRTWRQAISFALNYTYITKELQDGTVYRSNGPLAPDFPGYNASIKAATWDLAHARSLVQGMGLATGLVADNLTTGTNADAWKALSLQTWNYSYNTDNQFRADLGVLVKDNLDQIGINVVDQGMSWADFIYRAYGYMEPGGYDSLELFWIGGSPDYLSPYNMIFPLFSNKSASNSAQYYNADVEQWLEEVLEETDAAARAILYSKILHQIVEVDMPHAFGYHPMLVSVYNKVVKGFYQNALNQLYCYPIRIPKIPCCSESYIPGYSILYIFIISLVMITYLYDKNKETLNSKGL